MKQDVGSLEGAAKKAGIPDIAVNDRELPFRPDPGQRRPMNEGADLPALGQQGVDETAAYES